MKTKRIEGGGMERLRGDGRLQGLVLSVLLPGLMWMGTGGLLRANPSGGVVTHGAATIDGSVEGHLKVFQSSNRAVINWEEFNIGAGELTEFIQPGRGSVALSRVVSGNPSSIYGTLKANGGHILINTAGILVGPGGVVDVGGLNVLSTLDVDDNQFMAGGDMRFVGSTAAGVRNFGTITSQGGDVILLGNFVDNQGQIGALNGTVALGAGGEILLSQSGEAKISILRGGAGGGTGVNNAGTISGAAVEMKAHGNVYALAVNNSGTIRATGASNVKGRVVLSASGADGSASGKIRNTGSIRANNADGSGGEILIDAGPAGEADIAGGELVADGVGGRDGGSVTVLGDVVNVANGVRVSANGRRGGTVTLGGERSSRVSVGAGARVEANGLNGSGGVISVQGQTVTADGAIFGASGTQNGGEIDISGGEVSAINASAFDASGMLRGGRVNLDATGALELDAEVRANGTALEGGRIDATGQTVNLGGNANLEASGDMGGGQINVGGGFQGRDTSVARNARSTTVEAGARLSAEGTFGGDGGRVVVWSDKDTLYEGSISARATGLMGNGGLVEVSGKETLRIPGGSIAATAANGRSGTVLFDPGDVTVGNGGDIASSLINTTLQGGTSVIIATQGAGSDVTFLDTGQDNDWHDAIQWTNSLASFGVFAGGNILIQTHIRTSGAGSINLMAGWTGQESDFDPTGIWGGDFSANGTNRYDQINPLGPVNPEDVWEYYLEGGQFGFNGNVLMGGPTTSRQVVVGSRYGNTNVAGTLLAMITPQTVGPDTSERDFIHLGWRDTGQVFSIRTQESGAFDLNARAIEADNDVIVGINDVQYYRDVDGDTVPDGVYAINSTGILDENNTSTGGDPTLIPFSNRFLAQSGTSSGNWWWQQLDPGEDALNAGFVSLTGVTDPLKLGGRLPEYGAGQNDANRADINIALTGGLIMQGGGRNQNYVQIGHGGESTGWGDNRGLRDGTQTNNVNGQASRNLSYNGARDWSGTSIARLAPVYGNINILAGVDRDTVLYDRGDPEINLTGDTTSTGGFVRLEGWQNVEDGAQNNANNIASPDQSGDAYVQIGHLGNGQFGSVYGDINVKAGGDIEILAGAHNDNHATIGHTLDGLVVWDPPSNLAQQVRFFHNVGDMDNPNLRKGELFVHANGTDPARGWYAENTQTDRWDDDFWDAGTAVNGTPGQSPGGPVHVEALDGSTRKTISGNIRVESYGPEGITVKAYSTPDTRTQTSDDPLSVGDLDNDGVSARADGTDDVDDVDGWRTRRDTRFAGIGHGGYNDPISSDLDNERVRLRITTGDGTGDTATSVEFTGQDNSERYNRTTTFVNIVGDIEVTAHEGGLSVIAGNDTWDYAYVGHGGRSIADYESSSVVFGDITVDVAGDIDVIGGGVLATYTGESERDFFSHAQIGHHGRESGFQYYGGDILVNAGGDINVTAGRYRESGAKIGHQTDRGFGQVGGSFNRDEEFRHSMQITEVAANLTSVAVDDSSISITMDGDTETWAIDGFTTDIEVNAGGDVLLTHSDPGVRLNQNMYALDQVTGNTDNDFNDIRWSHTQIGHGGRETGALRRNGTNAAYYYKDKTGNIAVNAGTLDATTGAVTGGNVTMQNGAGLSWWTVIGHTFGASGADRADGPDTVAGSWNLIGNIDINALGNVVLDADYADSNDMVNLLGVTGVGDPARMNFVRVGHGGGLDNLDLNTLNDGTLVNGIEGFSNITIDAGGDMEIKGGKGSFGSYAQVGHGFNSDRGNDRALPNGFNGDITVNVMGDLTLLATPRAYNETPIIAQYDFIEGGAAVIGHGGNMLEDQLNGNISVYVGNDLSITASQANQQGGIALDSLGTPIGSIYNFAKIGHWSTELDNATNRDPVDSNMTGDIVVVVGNDMTMLGGTSTDLTDFGNGNVSLPVVNAFAQVGHSAPGVNGTKIGNITVLVGNDLTTVDGDAAGPGLQPNLNNYVMIGNGDWMRDGGGVHLPANGGQGVRAGDINVLAGNNISLDHTLVGHADPRLLPTVTTILSGNTFVGASRSTPFYGGPGTLEATNGSVFTSGLYGNGTEVRFYIPQRERNLMATDTRINQAFTTYRGVGGGGVSFADDIRVFDATRNGGIDAGDPDEIYLQPDLWWNNTGLVTTVGVADPFPADLAGVQGGSLATVDAPGGLPNLVALASGSFGEGTTEYRGADLYTIYYDAIEPVSLTPATLPVTVPELPPVVVEPEPVIVPIPFDYFPFLFVDKFDSFDRDDNNLNPGFGGGLLSGVGLFALLFGDGGGSGEEGVGLQTDSEGLNTLAMLFGLPVNAEDDDEDEEKKKEREEAAHQNLGRLYGVYWQYQPFSETGHYSSNQVFGLPEINEAATTVE